MGPPTGLCCEVGSRLPEALTALELWARSGSGHSPAYVAHIRFTEFSHCGRIELF